MYCQRNDFGAEGSIQIPPDAISGLYCGGIGVITTIISELPKFCDFQISTKINSNNKQMSKLFTFRQTQLLESHVSGHMVKREVTAEGEAQHHQHHQRHQHHQHHQHHHHQYINMTATNIILRHHPDSLCKLFLINIFLSRKSNEISSG